MNSGELGERSLFLALMGMVGILIRSAIFRPIRVSVCRSCRGVLKKLLPDGYSRPFGIPALAHPPVVKACRRRPSGQSVAWTNSVPPEVFAGLEPLRRLALLLTRQFWRTLSRFRGLVSSRRARSSKEATGADACRAAMGAPVIRCDRTILLNPNSLWGVVSARGSGVRFTAFLPEKASRGIDSQLPGSTQPRRSPSCPYCSFRVIVFSHQPPAML